MDSTIRIWKNRGKFVANAKPNGQFKHREQRIIEACGGRWSHQQNGYVIPATKVSPIWRFCKEGWDAGYSIVDKGLLFYPGSMRQDGMTYMEAKKKLEPCECSGGCLNCDPFADATKEYREGFTEVVPGVFFSDDSVHIVDRRGEAVMWNYDEICEDPDAWLASLCGVIIATQIGVEGVRERLMDKGTLKLQSIN